jgi:hypothetical protein
VFLLIGLPFKVFQANEGDSAGCWFPRPSAPTYSKPSHCDWVFHLENRDVNIVKLNFGFLQIKNENSYASPNFFQKDEATAKRRVGFFYVTGVTTYGGWRKSPSHSGQGCVCGEVATDITIDTDSLDSLMLTGSLLANGHTLSHSLLIFGVWALVSGVVTG